MHHLCMYPYRQSYKYLADGACISSVNKLAVAQSNPSLMHLCGMNHLIGTHERRLVQCLIRPVLYFLQIETLLMSKGPRGRKRWMGCSRVPCLFLVPWCEHSRCRLVASLLGRTCFYRSLCCPKHMLWCAPSQIVTFIG